MSMREIARQFQCGTISEREALDQTGARSIRDIYDMAQRETVRQESKSAA